MSGLKVEQILCDYRAELLGTDRLDPRFGWKLGSDLRGTRQKAYRLQVTDSVNNFHNPTWDTGVIESVKSIQVEYKGPELQSRTRYYYRVQVWDYFERESAWSEVGWWETAFLNADEWKASWITSESVQEGDEAEPVSMLRQSFKIKPDIASARIYATAAGLYDIYLNGTRVGNDWLTPGWTSYLHRHQYQTYDVTTALSTGENAIGIQLADGWYLGRLGWENKTNHYGDTRAALLQMHIEYADGSEEVVCSDTSWRSSTGPIVFSEIYDGEMYDARLEQSGWSNEGFNDLDWRGVKKLELPNSNLVAQENWPVRVTETLKPQAVIHTPSGETVLDMGQNMVGRVRLVANLSAGTTIVLHHAEVLDAEGNFYTDNLRSAKQKVEYIAKGGITESYAAMFTFQGFRYVKVEGLESLNDEFLMEAFTGEVMHSEMESTGDFECSNPMVNQLQRNIRWGQRGNFVDVPTDCPQRDERLGWTGDAQVFIRTAAFNYQVAPFFEKWMRDLKADQRSDGSVPFVIPNILDGNSSNAGEDQTQTSAAWGDAAVICPWIQYLCYGDDRLLAEQYDSMKAWVDYIKEQGADQHLWNTGFHFGDWLGLDAKENSYVGATPLDMVATSFFAYSTRIVRDASAVLGRAKEEIYYANLYKDIIAAYHHEFVTPAGRLAAPTQTAHVLALMFNLVEGEIRQRVASDLNKMIIKNNYHLTTGFVGTPYLCPVLSDNGFHATAVKLLLQESYPSWLYSITKGATTIWEHWDGIKPDGSFWSKDMNSYNHYAYGAIGEWLYRYVAGLDLDDTEAAYKRIRIHPRFAEGEITYARARLDSPYGFIESFWKEEEGLRKVEVIIPVNTTAQIVLMGARLTKLTDEKGPAATAEGILSAKESLDSVILLAGSGKYLFSYPI
ncbi:MAG: glycoside hydrolase family 78 protein [Paenibacillus sp.]|nr:glycoside hydrolase family 78 protein [Paenibacillus sp.]